MSWKRLSISKESPTILNYKHLRACKSNKLTSTVFHLLTKGGTVLLFYVLMNRLAVKQVGSTDISLSNVSLG